MKKAYTPQNKFKHEINFQNYVMKNYVEDVDYHMYFAYGDDILNGFDILNEKMVEDKKFMELFEKFELPGSDYDIE